MNQEHRSILKRNRVDIIENIANPIDVSEALWAGGVFTESMKQEVEAEKTPFGKVRKILDIVPKRGTEAFDKFYEALLVTRNGTVADLLKPHLAGTRPLESGQTGHALPQQETELPAIWPSEEDMDQPVQVRPCDVRSDLVIRYWQSADVYSMKKQKRGRCLIISNQTFKGPLKKDRYGVPRVILSVRHGTAKDVLNLKHLFQQLLFDVIDRHELKAEEIDKLLKEEARHHDHADADCFVLIICSHGTNRGIYGIDGKVITYEEVKAIFNSQNCPNLASKPKLVFLQTCHGEKSDVGGVSNSNVTDAGRFDSGDEAAGTQGVAETLEKLGLEEGLGDGGEESGEESEGYDSADARRVVSVPSNTDMLVARATHPEKSDVGGVSNSNVKDAGRFDSGDDAAGTQGDAETLEKLGLEEGLGDGGEESGEESEGYDSADARRVVSVPSNTDMLVARATHPGYVSFRNTVYGSWFIQAVVWVFQRYAFDKPLLDLLVLVNKLVAKGRTRNADGTQDLMQAALFESSFTKSFYFFPGVAESES